MAEFSPLDNVLPLRKPSLLALQQRLNNGTPELPSCKLTTSDVAALSPVTDLAFNLNGLSTNSNTPKRRISWSSDTPTNPDLFRVQNLDSGKHLDSPTFGNRLLRDVTLEKSSCNIQSSNLAGAKSCVGANIVNTPTGSSGLSSPLDEQPSKFQFTRTGLRRIRSLPSRALIQKPAEKENIPDTSLDQDGGDADDRSSSDLNFTETSPSALPGSRTFSRRLSVLGISDWVPSDSDSQDSGCVLSSSANERNFSVSTSSSSLLSICEENEFCSSFTEPSRVRHRKWKNNESSLKCESSDHSICCYQTSSGSFPSSVAADSEDNDGEAFEDGFELFNEADQNEEKQDYLLNDLFTGTIVHGFASSKDGSSKELPLSRSPRGLRRPSVRRSLSMVASVDCSPMSVEDKEEQENQISKTGDQSSLLLGRKRLLNMEDAVIAFKRPEPPGESGFLLESKRRKSVAALVAARRTSDSQIVTSPLGDSNQSSNRRVLAHRSYSYNDVRIDTALRRSDQERNLRGDYSGCNVLPVVEGRHADLKTISCDTLFQLVKGGFKDSVQCYSVVDCRYPYEFDGGHIVGAENLFTKDAIIQHFLSENETCKFKPDEEGTSEGEVFDTRPSVNRNVLIFHCEFSSERGPKLCRFLRKEDRQANKDNYPFLYYPEIYLLDGGYKEFFAQYKELCEPQQYKPMSHKDHRQDLNHFRAKSKSWNGDSKLRTSYRSGLKL